MSVRNIQVLRIRHMQNAKVDDSAIKKRVSMASLEMTPEESLLFLKRSVRLRFAESCLNKPQYFWKTFFGRGQKWKCFGHNPRCDTIKHIISQQTPHISCLRQWWRVDDLGLLCSRRSLSRTSTEQQSILKSNVRPFV